MPAKRVLCVDDDEDMRDMLIILLGLSGVEAVGVSDAGEALRLMARERFGLYVLDGQMPGVSGLTLCEHIRGMDADTPIVTFSGRDRQPDRSATALAGANAYLLKPDTHELISTVKHLLTGAPEAAS